MGFFNQEGNNYTLIAENTTKYYLELTRNYSDRFTEEVSLLATTAALDAQNYIFEDSIKLETIIRIARQASGKEELGPASYHRMKLKDRISKIERKNISPSEAFTSILSLLEPGERDGLEKDALFNLIFDLEIELFVIDNPEFHRSEIEAACYDMAETIYKAVCKTKRNYKGEQLFARATDVIMNNPTFKPLRKQLSIKD
jgi:hypothetical protein